MRDAFILTTFSFGVSAVFVGAFIQSPYMAVGGMVALIAMTFAC
jgi:hypothetical protein